MKLLNKRKIKVKIILIILICSLVAALMGILFDLSGSIMEYRKNIIQDTELHSKVIGEYCKLPLEFNYPKEAEVVLENLEHVPNILEAMLTDQNDQVFASYTRNGNRSKLIEVVSNNQTNLIKESEYFFRNELITNGKMIGKLYLIADVDVTDLIITKIYRSLILLLIMIAVVFVMANYLHRKISDPIVELAVETERIAETQNYQFDAQYYYEDEIGLLYQGFENFVNKLNIQSKEVNRVLYELSQSEERYRTLVNNLPVGIARSTPEGKIISANPAMAEMYGYESVDEVIKTPAFNFYPENNGRSQMLQQLLLNGFLKNYEDLELRKDGSRIWISANYRLTQEFGDYIDGVYIDITQKKLMELELINAKEKAEKSDRLKSAFLANMSHEIRTPLNSIIGFSELIQDDAFDESQKKSFLEQVIRNGHILLHVINDILDISRIESGELSMAKSKINLKSFFNDMFHHTKISAEAKNLSVKTFVDDGELDDSVCLHADLQRLTQVFTNLISNSLKFTNVGYIEIGRKQTAEFVVFHVKDTGIGIPPEYHAEIFKRFRQVEDANSRKYGGNGLGLAITRNLVELMGGKIWLESEPGKGSTFYFTIPLADD